MGTVLVVTEVLGECARRALPAPCTEGCGNKIPRDKD